MAEDEALVRGGLCALLELEPDMELAGEAADGAAAVEGVLRTHPDVVLMDVQMPVLDGIEATRRILAAGSRARIVMVTTFDQDEYVYKALRAGASGFLLKALAPERLAAAVRTIAGGESVLDPTLTRRLIEEYLVRPEPDERLARRLEDLTDREREVWLLLAQGKSNAEMGQRPVPQRRDDQVPRHAAAEQARRAQPRRRGRARLRERPDPARRPARGVIRTDRRGRAHRSVDVGGAGSRSRWVVMMFGTSRRAAALVIALSVWSAGEAAWQLTGPGWPGVLAHHRPVGARAAAPALGGATRPGLAAVAVVALVVARDAAEYRAPGAAAQSVVLLAALFLSEAGAPPRSFPVRGLAAARCSWAASW